MPTRNLADPSERTKALRDCLRDVEAWMIGKTHYLRDVDGTAALRAYVTHTLGEHAAAERAAQMREPWLGCVSLPSEWTGSYARD